MNLRPAPWIERDGIPFWEAAKRGELVAQSCIDCGVLRSPPRPMCPDCHSLANEFRVLSGRGTVYTWVIPRYPPIPAYGEGNIVAVINLEEGVRMVSNLREIEYDDVTADMRVEVFFEDAEQDYKIPVFRPATA